MTKAPARLWREKPTKTLAIDPGTRYMGIAVFENSDLIYWKVQTLQNRTATTRLFLQEVRQIITKLIEHHQIDVVTQEKVFFAQCKCSERLNKQVRAIRILTKQKNLTYLEYAPTTVRKHICQNGWATKKETAKIVVSIYPELAVHLDQKREWKNKYWGNMFDAVALGLCCWRDLTEKLIIK